MKRTGVWLSVLAAAVAVLVVARIGTPAFAQQREVTLTIFARGYTWDQPAPWTVAEAELQRRRPDVKCNFIEEGFGHSDLRTKSLTAASGGNPPDVVQVDVIWLE